MGSRAGDMDSDEQFRPPMSTEDFRIWGKKMVDYICDYLDTIGDRNVIPDVEPGYLRPMMPQEAPENAESWSEIFQDINDLIMPGITHWQHPRFHAYFPAGNSFPSIMGDMLGDALGTIGFSWAASPAMAELEMVVLDWLAGLLGLPEQFTHEGSGGGALQGSASDCLLLSMLAARYQAIEQHTEYFSEAGNSFPETAVLSRLVAYCSNLAHSCVEKAGMISFVQVRQLDVDENFSMRTDALEAAILEDIKQGFIPFYVAATIGTTACASFDNVSEIGPIARRYNLWLHIDGAYGVNSCICPEFRYLLDGVELADSINFNPNKWLLTNFDASVLWVADKSVLTRSMVVNPVYLQHKFSSKAIDFRHWGIPLSRRFRALKLWFVIRKYGAKGLRSYIRNHVKLAKLFASLVETDPRFQIVGKVELGLVCFRIRGSNTLTQCLIRTINESRELHVVPAMVNDLYIIRFAVCRESANEEDIHHAWKIIKHFGEQIITAEASLRQWREHTKKNSIKKKRRAKAAASALKLDPEAIKEGVQHPVEAVHANQNTDLERLCEVPEEGKENESETDDENEDDDHSSTSSSDLGDLDVFEMDDNDIIELATERLMDLKELGAKEAYNVLAQQLRNLGVTEVKTYEECDLNSIEIDPTPTNEMSKPNDTDKFECLEPELVTDKNETEILTQEEERAAQANRMGRFKSLCYAMAIKGADKVVQDNRRSLQNPQANQNGTARLRPSIHLMTPESSFLNGSLDPHMEHKLCQDAISSTPFVNSREEPDQPRQSISGTPGATRRFSSFNPCTNMTHNGTHGSIASSGGTPVVARLVSMVMNASGNGPMNTSQARQHRRSLRPSMLDEIKEMSNSAELKSKSTSVVPNADVSTINRSRKFLNSHNSAWRVGMNQEDDIDDVFVCDSDLCVGSFSKESTLTRLRRQTLLKMISDPISYKNNRKQFRSFRENRRMTTLASDFEPRERTRSEYARRPTVQICENIHRDMNKGDLDDELLIDLKRRNKSMIETSSVTAENEPNNNSLSGKIVRQHAQFQPDVLKKSFLSSSSDNKIEEEDEDTS